MQIPAQGGVMRRKISQKPALKEFWQEWFNSWALGIGAFLLFLADQLHYLLLSNPILGFVCLPLHTLLCCCSGCYYRRRQIRLGLQEYDYLADLEQKNNWLKNALEYV